ncbi:hypothetical protein [Nocardioides convexus]|uniref:hypothetical protein n=1 Tax=Nocardioides convexus TaxID=2712224 RepID=UPI002418A1C6|nr:hypothetical protein [Nocardioides convexus]
MATVERLRATPGDALFVGGVQAGAVADRAWADRRATSSLVHPRVVGHGPYLFEGLPQALDLRLVDRADLSSVAVALTYER